MSKTKIPEDKTKSVDSAGSGRLYPVNRLLSHPNLALFARIILGTIFLLTALIKLAHPDEFALAVQNYGILPPTSVRSLTSALSWLELEVGAFLLAGLFTRFMAGVAGMLLVGFLAMMGFAMFQGKAIDCGCFTGLIEETVGTGTLIRDLVMMALLPPLFLSLPHRLSLDARIFPFQRSPIKNSSLLAAFLLLVFGLGFVSTVYGARLLPEGNSSTSTISTSKPSEDNSAISPAGWLMGPKNAKIQIVIYSDFQCPSCRAMDGALKTVLAKYNGQVAVTFYHYPLQKHELAMPAAEAAEAAGEQGRFWEMHDAIFANQDQLTETTFRALATRLGLDMKRYDDAIASGRPRAIVLADIAQAKSIGVSYTPYVLLDGQPILGSDVLIKEVEQKVTTGRP